MDSHRPSRTAQGAALYRAAHQIVDSPAVFADPLALRIVGRKAEAEVRNLSERRTKPSARRLRAFIAARSRFADDCFAEAVKRGVHQYVVLGAGLDTFAYRNAYADVCVFEVDHPATQGWKQARLAEAAIKAPAALSYVPVDFERETLRDGLTGAGFDFSAPAFFAWLGVVPYLSRAAITDTLTFVAQAMKPESEILFDYTEPPGARGFWQRLAFARFAQRVAASGEPLKSFFLPGTLTSELRALGFSYVEDLNADSLNTRYFSERKDGLALAGTGHLMRARV